MRIEETRVKNFSLQFVSQADADKTFAPLLKSQDKSFVELVKTVQHRLDTTYAHDDIKLTTVVYAAEIPVFLTGALALTQSDGKVSSKSLLKRWFD